MWDVFGNDTSESCGGCTLSWKSLSKASRLCCCARERTSEHSVAPG